MSLEKNDSLKDRLRQEIGECLSSDLQNHLKKEVVILVSNELDLLEVALKVAQDDSAVVSGWMKSSLLARPSLQAIERWQKDPQAPFRSIIVQPFVLVQALS